MATITGTNGNDFLLGTVDADLLDGLAGADTLSGGRGHDTLDGGSGNDAMEEGVGNDVYLVDSAGDSIQDSAAVFGAASFDRVVSTVTYDLPYQVEVLVLVGDEFQRLDGTGDTGNETLEGTPGPNRLDGSYGIDTMLGMGGDDTLVYDPSDSLANGGLGEDVLLFGSYPGLNLAGRAGTSLRGIEAIDLADPRAATLTLTSAQLLALSDESDTLRVSGNADDRVSVSGGAWVQGEDLDVGGALHHSYSDGVATMLVDADVGALFG